MSGTTKEKCITAMDVIKKTPKVAVDYSSKKGITVIAIYGEAAETILKVLDDEKTRINGCGWCNKYTLEFQAVDKDGNTITVGDHDELGGKCDFCPVCGKKLKGTPI